MEHLAIDLGGRDSQICVRSATGEILDERRWPTARLDRYLAERPPSRVIVETCSEAFWVADQARAAGHEVRVVSATRVRALGVGARRLKTDQRDARTLSEVSCRIDLASVHVPRHEAQRVWNELMGVGGLNTGAAGIQSLSWVSLMSLFQFCLATCRNRAF